MERINREKAGLIYGVIDGDADFFRCPVERDSRSTMNIVWRLPSEDLEKRFLKEATARGMVGLKGHRSVGGIRASIYNAVPLASCEALASFMREFRKTA
jgi:phosphoserine aminotransferase